MWLFTDLCQVGPHTDGLSLLEHSVQLPAVQHIVKVTPQALQHGLGKLHLVVIPAGQSMAAPVQQDLRRQKTNKHMKVYSAATSHMTSVSMDLTGHTTQHAQSGRGKTTKTPLTGEKGTKLRETDRLPKMDRTDRGGSRTFLIMSGSYWW